MHMKHFTISCAHRQCISELHKLNICYKGTIIKSEDQAKNPKGLYKG